MTVADGIIARKPSSLSTAWYELRHKTRLQSVHHMYDGSNGDSIIRVLFEHRRIGYIRSLKARKLPFAQGNKSPAVKELWGVVEEEANKCGLRIKNTDALIIASGSREPCKAGETIPHSVTFEFSGDSLPVDSREASRKLQDLAEAVRTRLVHDYPGLAPKPS